jgi:hypothetical protein
MKEEENKKKMMNITIEKVLLDSEINRTLVNQKQKGLQRGKWVCH